MKPRLAITMGDINGIGPEILVKALARPEIWRLCAPVVIGSASILDEARQYARNCPQPVAINRVDEVAETEQAVHVLDGGQSAPLRRAGQLDAAAGRCAVEWVKLAARLAMEGRVSGMVTCPINKEGIHRAGYDYAGHTDLLAELTSCREYRMCLFSDAMRIIHVSAHCSLAEAIAMVTADRVAATIRIGHDALVRIGIPRGRIAVAGLNPHAGEAGAFGSEEAREIAPAVAACQREEINCSGPYPPDTVFRRMNQGEFDMVAAMYHDQGHIPLKLVAMERGVNVTLGIPIVRTSVDHGTAYDIAGRGVACEGSLCAAISLAAQMATKR